jgi:hypothetical protein
MISVGKAWQLVAILLTFVVVTAAALLWRPHAPSFDARWVAMPPNINLETYRAARKASARPAFCMWEMFDYPGGGCRAS